MAEREKEGSRGVDPVHKTKMIIIATGTAREYSIAFASCVPVLLFICAGDVSLFSPKTLEAKERGGRVTTTLFGTKNQPLQQPPLLRTGSGGGGRGRGGQGGGIGSCRGESDSGQ